MFNLKWVLLHSVEDCKNLRIFRQIHAQLVTSGLVCDDFVTSKVIEFFANFVEYGDYACDYLKQGSTRLGSFPFNSLINGYVGELPQLAVSVYRRMVRDGFVPDMFTFPVLLKACSNFSGSREGRQIHGVVVKLGLLADHYVQNSLICCYGACGDFSCAGRVFDEMLVRDVVSWNSLISGFMKVGHFDEAISLFFRMDVEPSIATLVSVLAACARKGDLCMGKGIHGVIERRFKLNLILGNAMLDMYVKNGCLYEAKKIFDELPTRDIVSWTIMITGLVQSDHPKESLELFSMMRTLGINPDAIILTSVLSACSSLGTLDFGTWVHEYINQRRIKWDVHIGTAIVDMYAKCGCIEMALQIFYNMPKKNTFTWNALLCGLAMHGLVYEALNLFEVMIKSGVKPNEVTFLAILTACCHSGLVNEGRKYFNNMSSQLYNLLPKLEHYGCMIDLFCRAGLLEEAVELARTMPMKPDVLIWGVLLNACKTVGNVDLSHHIRDYILELDPEDSGVFVLLSNISATNERWSDVIRLRRLMKDRGVEKAPGSSVIEVDGKAHEFVAGDISHLQTKEIYKLLSLINSVYHESH
ncbi:pentatricopeptide repeat-containing protein At4g38010 [Benincasa hispida]|uniref:pentatricopeptide repeat-containing protein At4g38010 n=1 Tax=Benincasa hispida TaxID=102211 RepID=UPI0019029FDC|nr:pentatricopeptide repeat-containing protein At4g38010 [Benincasa hispida]XP_038889934.1 pentatricopeptide repeat-containing protein At4g38010 [Benincasa hispida]XP_038889935.1 pentatricopeptide repeat-containing protein At4g38010 [Benincasa hispida]XP_038889936.1 pentatricopeptide repeat-containing protein At4g38010 [Benincasa hispida]XP_038889937.1 pentatricopeptide repeat-containing protein At4g38010 [Benincasa hispida]XP_038889938.1 pentatricopeptide repeat-containing protein At4g38010 [